MASNNNDSRLFPRTALAPRIISGGSGRRQVKQPYRQEENDRGCIRYACNNVRQEFYAREWTDDTFEQAAEELAERRVAWLWEKITAEPERAHANLAALNSRVGMPRSTPLPPQDQIFKVMKWKVAAVAFIRNTFVHSSMFPQHVRYLKDSYWYASPRGTSPGGKVPFYNAELVAYLMAREKRSFKELRLGDRFHPDGAYYCAAKCKMDQGLQFGHAFAVVSSSILESWIDMSTFRFGTRVAGTAPALLSGPPAGGFHGQFPLIKRSGFELEMDVRAWQVGESGSDEAPFVDAPAWTTVDPLAVEVIDVEELE